MDAPGFTQRGALMAANVPGDDRGSDKLICKQWLSS